MGSAWVEHVKSVYAKGKKGGMSYKQAMQKAKASWAKKKGASGKASKAPAKKKKKAADDDDEKVAVEKPKRAKKKARKQVVDGKSEQAQDAPQSSRKARSSRASRKSSIKRRDVAPKGIAGVGAPYKE